MFARLTKVMRGKLSGLALISLTLVLLTGSSGNAGAQDISLRHLVRDLGTVRARQSSIVLAELGTRVLPVLLPATMSPNASARYWAAAAVGRIYDRKSVALLRHMLHDPIGKVRLSAYVALGNLIDLAHSSETGRLRNDPFPALKDAVKIVSSTDRMTGMTYKLVPTRSPARQLIARMEGDDFRLRIAAHAGHYSLFSFGQGHRRIVLEEMNYYVEGEDAGQIGKVKVLWFNHSSARTQYLTSPDGLSPLDGLDEYFKQPNIVM